MTSTQVNSHHGTTQNCPNIPVMITEIKLAWAWAWAWAWAIPMTIGTVTSSPTLLSCRAGLPFSSWKGKRILSEMFYKDNDVLEQLQSWHAFNAVSRSSLKHVFSKTQNHIIQCGAQVLFGEYQTTKKVKTLNKGCSVNLYIGSNNYSALRTALRCHVWWCSPMNFKNLHTSELQSWHWFLWELVPCWHGCARFVHGCVGTPETAGLGMYTSACYHTSNELYVDILTKNPVMIAQVLKQKKGSILSPRSNEFSCFTAKIFITVRSMHRHVCVTMDLFLFVFCAFAYWGIKIAWAWGMVSANERD